LDAAAAAILRAATLASTMPDFTAKPLSRGEIFFFVVHAKKD